MEAGLVFSSNYLFYAGFSLHGRGAVLLSMLLHSFHDMSKRAAGVLHTKDKALATVQKSPTPQQQQ
jgi:hypothetical protein